MSSKSQKELERKRAAQRRAQALRDNLRRRKAAAKTQALKAAEKPQN